MKKWKTMDTGFNQAFREFLSWNASISSLLFLFLSVNVALNFAKKSFFDTAILYMLNLEFKFEAANTTCIIYHLNSGAV